MAEPAESFRNVSNTNAQEAVETFEKTNVEDTLTENSRKVRRALLFLSSVSIAIAWFELTIERVPYFELPAYPGGVVPALLGAAVLYHLLSFAMYGWIDIRRWRMSLKATRMYVDHQLMYRVEAQMNALKGAMKQGEGLEQASKVTGILNDTVLLVNETKAHLKKVHAAEVRLTRLNRFVAWFWEFWLPVAIGLAAFAALADRSWVIAIRDGIAAS